MDFNSIPIKLKSSKKQENSAKLTPNDKMEFFDTLENEYNTEF